MLSPRMYTHLYWPAEYLMKATVFVVTAAKVEKGSQVHFKMSMTVCACVCAFAFSINALCLNPRGLLSSSLCACPHLLSHFKLWARVVIWSHGCALTCLWARTTNHNLVCFFAFAQTHKQPCLKQMTGPDFLSSAWPAQFLCQKLSAVDLWKTGLKTIIIFAVAFSNASGTNISHHLWINRSDWSLKVVV